MPANCRVGGGWEFDFYFYSHQTTPVARRTLRIRNVRPKQFQLQLHEVRQSIAIQ